jgi:hypothetical protein
LGQEFFIKSSTLEDKVRQILPSQGGLGQGFDLSASTQIVPIVDLTESAEGSVLREDLQRAFSHTTTTRFNVTNTTTTVTSTTGYFRVFGNCHITGAGFSNMSINDGLSDKIILTINGDPSVTGNNYYDFMIFLSAGDSFKVSTSANVLTNVGIIRQIADINGELVNP